MDKGKVFERLMLLARKKRLQVQFLPLQASYGILCNDRIGIANNMSIEQINHTLSHELAHAYLHYDKGTSRKVQETMRNKRKEPQKCYLILQVHNLLKLE